MNDDFLSYGAERIWIPGLMYTDSLEASASVHDVTFTVDASDGSIKQTIYSPEGVLSKFDWWLMTNGYSKEDVPKMDVKEERVFGSKNDYRYAVMCCNHDDLSQAKILKCISVIKAKLMFECMPYSVENIKCKMTPIVKNNIILAYRRLSMYGKKTPFVARFDEYGRRLNDEIKIDTMRGMDIEIVDPEIFGEDYLLLETNINKGPMYSDDLPF